MPGSTDRAALMMLSLNGASISTEYLGCDVASTTPSEAVHSGVRRCSLPVGGTVDGGPNVRRVGVAEGGVKLAPVAGQAEPSQFYGRYGRNRRGGLDSLLPLERRPYIYRWPFIPRWLVTRSLISLPGPDALHI